MRDMVGTMTTARDIRDGWNSWSRRKEAMFRHNDLVNRMFKKYKLENQCEQCGAVMQTLMYFRPCPVCKSENIASPYGALEEKEK